MVVRKYLVLGGIALAGGGLWVYTAQRAEKKPSCCQPKAHAGEPSAAASASAPTAATPAPAGTTPAGGPGAASAVALGAASVPVAASGAPGAALAAAGVAPTIVVPKDEASLMAALRASKDPATRLLLAQDGNARFPDSLDRGERAHAAVEALFALGRAPDGRTEAWHFLEAHPDDPWAPKIRAYTSVPSQ